MLAATPFATGSSSTMAQASEGYIMPFEGTPHARCFMTFSSARDLYGRAAVARIRREQATVAQTIARFEPVTMLCVSRDAEDARSACGPGVTVMEIDLYDIWARDALPTFARAPDGTLTAVSWNFNVWGEKFPRFKGYDRDRDLAARLAGALDIPLVHAGIVAEGGAIETDGEGTLLTTETCLLNANRNPNLSREEIEIELKRFTGAQKVLWLPGSPADTITDGHIDGIARFVAPGIVLAEVSDDPQDIEYADLRANADRLETMRDAQGRKLEVIRIKRPRWERMPRRGEYFAASYINYYVANGGLVMSKFADDERDEAARDLITRLHPEREVIQIAVDEICEGGGGIHCNTQQMPA